MDQEIIDKVEAGFESIGRLYAAVRLRDALTEALALAREVNGYLDRAPWFKVVQQQRQEAATTIYTALRCIDDLKTLLAPVLPFTSQQVHEFLGYEGTLFGEQRIETFQESERAHNALTYHVDPAAVMGRWESSALRIGQVLREPQPLFPKLEPTLIDEERARLGQPREAKSQPG